MYYDIKESGKRIKELRKGMGFTQEQLAEKVGLSTVMVSSIERGVTGTSIDTMGMIAVVLKASVDYIAFGKKTLVIEGDLSEKKIEAMMQFVRVMME